MVKYKSLLLSPLSLLPAGVDAANAADMRLPVKAPAAQTYTPFWHGLYGGLNLGIIADRSSQSAFLDTGATFPYCWANDCNFSNKQTAVGLLGGLQLGYNFQSGHVVYGVETDIALSTAKTSTSGLSPGAPIFGSWTAETGVRALGTARLRIGYDFDGTLLYATGGLAYADMRNTFQEGNAAGGFTFNWSDTGWRLGYAIGGGIEYAFARDWSVKAEGLYYNLGQKDHISRDTFATPDGAGLTDRMSGIVGRVGLNYHFH